MKKKKKMLVILLVTLMVFSSAFSVVYAADGYRSIKAWFGDINILNNGKEIGDHVPRFMVDGLIYVPIQKIGEIFDKNWSWDQATRTMRFTDKPSQNDNNQSGQGQNNFMLWMQVMEKEEKIKELEGQVEKLKKQLKEKEEEVVDVDDLEDELKDDNDKIDRADVEDIKLDIDGDDVEITIEVDYRDWRSVREKDIEDYLEDVYDDIDRAMDDLDEVEGTIEIDSNRYDDIDFDFSSSGNARLERGRSNINSVRDLELEMKRSYDKIDGKVDVNVDVSGNEDRVRVEIEMKSSSEDRKFNDLRDYEIEDYIKDVCDYILGAFERADINGEINDSRGNREVRFDVNRGGRVRILD